MEEQRLAFVRRSLTILGLELPSPGVHYTHPLPQFLISPEGCTTALSAMLEGSSGPCRVDGGKDTFEVHELSEYDEVMNTLQPSLAESQTGHIFLCPDGTSPLKELTPHFDVSRYFNYLETFKAGRDKPTAEYQQQIGEALLYGEVINSTADFKAFWATVAGAFKDNAYVIFDTNNEVSSSEAGEVDAWG